MLSQIVERGPTAMGTVGPADRSRLVHCFAWNGLERHPSVMSILCVARGGGAWTLHLRERPDISRADAHQQGIDN